MLKVSEIAKKEIASLRRKGIEKSEILEDSADYRRDSTSKKFANEIQNISSELSLYELAKVLILRLY